MITAPVNAHIPAWAERSWHACPPLPTELLGCLQKDSLPFPAAGLTEDHLHSVFLSVSDYLWFIQGKKTNTFLDEVAVS